MTTNEGEGGGAGEGGLGDADHREATLEVLEEMGAKALAPCAIEPDVAVDEEGFESGGQVRFEEGEDREETGQFAQVKRARDVGVHLGEGGDQLARGDGRGPALEQDPRGHRPPIAVVNVETE
jgi:hypothetical protein